VPQELRDFVKQLLQRKPAYRLGQGVSGADAIKKHPWFNGFEWDAFVAKKLKAPFIPVVSLTLVRVWRVMAYLLICRSALMQRSRGLGWQRERV
jgi:hypothetical protein